MKRTSPEGRLLLWLAALLLPALAHADQCAEGLLELAVTVSGSTAVPPDLACRYSLAGEPIILSDGRGCVEKDVFFHCRGTGVETAYFYSDHDGKVRVILDETACYKVGQEQAPVRLYRRGNGRILEVQPGEFLCPHSESGPAIAVSGQQSGTVGRWGDSGLTSGDSNTTSVRIPDDRWPAALSEARSIAGDLYPSFLAEGRWPPGVVNGLARFEIGKRATGGVTLQVPVPDSGAGVLGRVRISGAPDLLLRRASDSREPRDVRVGWTRGGELTGRLRSSEGAPVGGLLVSLLDAEEPRLLDQSVSDAAGRFLLEPEHGGMVRLVLGEPDFPLLEEYWDASRDNQREVVVEAGAMMVVVRDENGLPVAETRVTVSGITGGHRSQGSILQTTSGYGIAPFPVVPTGSVMLELHREGFATAALGPLLVEDGRVTPVVVVLRSGASLKGVVLASDGVGVEGTLLCWSAEGGEACERSGRAGAFELKNLPRGIVRVTARHEEMGTTTAWVDLRRDDFVELHLEDGATVYGQIEDWREEEDLSVEIGVVGHPDNCAIDVHGRFVCSGIPPGRHRVEMKTSYGIGKPERSVQSETVVLEAGEHKEVVFEMGSALTGSVVENGEPARGWTIRWMRWEGDDPGGNLPRSLLEATTTESGGYQVFGVVPGNIYTVSLSGEGRTYLEEVIVEGSEANFELDGETVRGRVTNKVSGEGLGGTEILAYDPEAWPAVSRRWPDPDGGFSMARQARGRQRIVTADEDGFFELRLENGPWVVRGNRRGFVPGKKAITVGGDEPAVDLELTPSGGVWGQVREPAGLGRPWTTVYAYCRGAASVVHSARTSDKGWFVFDKLRGGACALLAVAPEGMGMVPAFDPARGLEDPEFLPVRLNPVGRLAVLLPQGAETVARESVPLRIIPEGGLDIVPILRRLKTSDLRVEIERVGARYRVVVPALPIGRYKVFWPGRMEETAVVLAGGETTVEY